MTHNKERQVLTCKYNCGFSTKQGTQLSYHYRMQHLTNTSGDAVKSKEMLKNLNVSNFESITPSVNLPLILLVFSK